MQPEILFTSAVILVLTVVMIFYYSRQKKPVKTALLSGISGILSLFLAKAAFIVCHTAFPFNPVSLCVSALLGIPGVALLCVIQLFC